MAMKQYVSFSLFPESGKPGRGGTEVSSPILSEMLERWPQFISPAKTSFMFNCDPNSETAKEVFEFLKFRADKQARFTRFPSIYDDPTQYQLQGAREFEIDEIDAAELLWCTAAKELSGSGFWEYDKSGDVRRRTIERGTIKKQPIGSSINGFDLLITDSSRREIEEQGFRNLRFEEVVVNGKKPPHEPIWMLMGSTPMPPVLNKLVNGEGNPPDSPTKGKFTQGCWVDDLYFPPVYHYRRREVEATLGEFDVASTTERWHSGEYRRRTHHLICSQRFRRWCEARKWKMNWVPVELED